MYQGRTWDYKLEAAETLGGDVRGVSPPNEGWVLGEENSWILLFKNLHFIALYVSTW